MRDIDRNINSLLLSSIEKNYNIITYMSSDFEKKSD